jgi:hypothetical protein
MTTGTFCERKKISTIIKVQPNLTAWTMMSQRMDFWLRIYKKKYYWASQAHRKQNPPRNFLYLKKLKFESGYYCRVFEERDRS